MKRTSGWCLALTGLLSISNAGALAQAPAQPADKKISPVTEALPLRPAAGDTALQKLAKERYNEAVAEMRVAFLRVTNNSASVNTLFGPTERLLRSGLAARDRLGDRTAFLAQILDKTKEIERLAAALHKSGQGQQAEVHRARFLRLDVEIQLLQARAGLQK